MNKITKKFSEIKDYTFAELCNKFKRFKVPAFQRTYNWTAKQINDLWEDMISNEKEYFIGDIVCLEASEESENRLVIIDGQQRLFTISLILAAIRDEYSLIKAKKKEEKEWIRRATNQINQQYLFHTEITPPFKESLRLLPGKENLKNVYKKILKNNLDIKDKEVIKRLDDNQRKYVKNYITIKRLVKKYISGDELNKLQELLNNAAFLLFIVIVCGTDNDAYKIFEGLNATGIGLSVSDLLKNAVLSEVKGKNQKNIVEDNWEQIESIFETTKINLFQKFLRHQWISREGYITTNKLFKVIKEKKLKGEEDSDIVDYTRILLEDAKIYIGFNFEECESNLKDLNKESKNIIRRFKYLDIAQIYELLLAHYNKFINTKTYTEKQFNSDLKKLWIFSFRAKFIGLNPSEYEKVFADQCKFIGRYTKKRMDTMNIKFFKELSKLIRNDQAFLDNFVTDISYKEGKKNDLIQYLLDTILRTENPSIQVAEPTIEHILPKEPSKWGFERNEVKDFVHDIGNLTLLYKNDNKKLGNETMKIKVERVFSKSSFKLNRRLAKKEKEFTKNPRKAIEKRGRELAEIANKIWKI